MKPGQDHRERLQCDCGTPLNPTQSLYCSTECRNRYASTRTDQLTEPKTVEELNRFYKTIEEREKQVQVEEKALIVSQTPEDDSPEAEKRMRELLAPDPHYWRKMQ